MIGVREEVMGPHMTKFHLEGLPGGAVIHRFTEPDGGDPHDHPWDFVSHVMFGGYVENVYDRQVGLITEFVREPGDAFFVPAQRVHRIVRLLDGPCWTIITPRQWRQTPGFWQFRDDGPYRRDWNGDWEKK